MSNFTNITKKEATQIRLYLNKARKELDKEFKATKKKLREFKKEISGKTEEEYEEETGESFYGPVLAEADDLNHSIERILEHLEQNFEVECINYPEDFFSSQNNKSEIVIRTDRNRLLKDACLKLFSLTNEINRYLEYQAEQIGNTEHRDITRVIEFQNN